MSKSSLVLVPVAVAVAWALAWGVALALPLALPITLITLGGMTNKVEPTSSLQVSRHQSNSQVHQLHTC